MAAGLSPAAFFVCQRGLNRSARMVVMDALWQLTNRLLADPVVVIYWFLGSFALGVYGGWRIERTRWETRLTVGDDCPHCQETLHQCTHLKRQQSHEKRGWVDRAIEAFMIHVLGLERRDEKEG
jgi:hypothetical protein